MANLIWITGLSGSGKTSIAREVFSLLKKNTPSSILLDGDDFREIMGNTYGHSREDRLIVAMQIARMCNLLVSQDVNVVCSTISLFKEVHEFNRKVNENYYEIYVKCDMEELIRRDQKGIYTKALKGEIKNVVGVDIAFDEPKEPFWVIDNTNKIDIIEVSKKIINQINF